MPVVVGSWGTVGQVTSTKNQDVVSTSERIWVHGDGSLNSRMKGSDSSSSDQGHAAYEEDIRVVTRGLLST